MNGAIPVPRCSCIHPLFEPERVIDAFIRDHARARQFMVFTCGDCRRLCSAWVDDIVVVRAETLRAEPRHA